MPRDREWLIVAGDEAFNETSERVVEIDLGQLNSGETVGHAFVQFTWLNEWTRQGPTNMEKRELWYMLRVEELNQFQFWPSSAATRTLLSGVRADVQPQHATSDTDFGTSLHWTDESHGQHSSPSITYHCLLFFAIPFVEGTRTSQSVVHYYAKVLKFSG